MRSQSFLFRATSLMFVAAIAVSACTSATPTPGASTAPSAAAGPVSGGTVTIPIGADPTLNPWSPNAFVESLFINRAIFEGLTKPGKDLAPAPDLAESWTTASDGLSWTFKLRSGVKWSDGKPFTADDVAFTFNDIVLKPDLGAQNRASYAAVKSVTVVDPTTVRFDLSRKFAALPVLPRVQRGHPAEARALGEPAHDHVVQQGRSGQHGPVQGGEVHLRSERVPGAQRELLRTEAVPRQGRLHRRGRPEHADRAGAVGRPADHDPRQQGGRGAREERPAASPSCHDRSCSTTGFR